jgi:hypothetical protein
LLFLPLQPTNFLSCIEPTLSPKINITDSAEFNFYWKIKKICSIKYVGLKILYIPYENRDYYEEVKSQYPHLPDSSLRRLLLCPSTTISELELAVPQPKDSTALHRTTGSGKEAESVGIPLMRWRQWACGNPSCAAAAGASSSARTATPARQVRTQYTSTSAPLLALAPAFLGEPSGL